MGTKLRNFRTHMTTKIAVFILFVISVTAAVVQMNYLTYSDTMLESLFVKDYKDSDDFLRKYAQVAIGNCAAITYGDMIQQENSDYYYYITDGSKTFSNTENKDRSFFEKFDKAFYACEKGSWSFGKNTNPKAIMYYSTGFNKKYTVYIAFTPDFLAQKQIEWDASRNRKLPLGISTASFTVLALVLLIYLISVTGRKPGDKELHLSKMDVIYSDILIFAFIPIGLFWLNGIADSPFYSPFLSGNGRLNASLVYTLIWTDLITSVVSIICCLLLLSIVRKIKASKFLKHSLIFIAIYKVYDFFKSIFDGRMFKKYPLTRSLFYRQAIFISASAVFVALTLLLLFATPPLVFVPIASEIVMIYWYITGNNKTFDDINKGFNESLEEQMKSERMKIALITNVSHDLKTPLTSIISYVDLLSKEENLSETAGDYVKILAEKSNRLKNIVSDLFDLAKSSSGNMPVDLESIDIKKLIEQTLGDMEDEIEKSGIQIKTKLPGNPVNIISDGKKLYRVFQNVIDNALKYSLENSRIFVELEETNGKAIAAIKNTSKYEMDFTAEEILQRFNRGDKARTTEGSGLGLSIAESFTNVCGGSFNVEIDGDLFKVTISFNLGR